MSYTNCPYCKEELDIDTTDIDNIDRTYHEYQCPECGNNFVFIGEFSLDIISHKADCLNGKPHDWKPSITYPPCFTQMKCAMCGGNREPTQEERKKYNISSVEEYLKKISQETPAVGPAAGKQEEE